jgi:hypothetical protein
VLFTREPDYFDSDFTTGEIIHRNNKLLVGFSDGHDAYSVEVKYPFLYRPGQYVKVIYEASTPGKARVYSILGYWITFGELFASLFIVTALYWIATRITKNPTPTALIEELEMGKKKPRKPKYDS